MNPIVLFSLVLATILATSFANETNSTPSTPERRNSLLGWGLNQGINAANTLTTKYGGVDLKEGLAKASTVYNNAKTTTSSIVNDPRNAARNGISMATNIATKGMTHGIGAAVGDAKNLIHHNILSTEEERQQRQDEENKRQNPDLAYTSDMDTVWSEEYTKNGSTGETGIQAPSNERSIWTKAYHYMMAVFWHVPFTIGISPMALINGYVNLMMHPMQSFTAAKDLFPWMEKKGGPHGAVVFFYILSKAEALKIAVDAIKAFVKDPNNHPGKEIIRAAKLAAPYPKAEAETAPTATTSEE